MPPLPELVNLTLAMINLNLEFLTNLLNLTIEASRNVTLVTQGQNLNFSNVWGIIYGALITGSYGMGVFNSSFTIATTNTTALANVGNAVNHIGKNVTSIIGDFTGRAGLSYVLNNTTHRLRTNPPDLWNFTWNLVNVTNMSIQFLVELGKVINRTFY
ncbi:MAG: hypothetical protein NZ879_00895 [Archaeoglobaceae archaeon]|nr:hypothetical protein [Archaeoglobaceae archaeon]MDW8117523.1 hypothetical protein [Archaeoglobaceae archaeon]